MDQPPRVSRLPFRTFSFPFYFLLFAFSFSLYLRTLAPGLLDGDSAEFQMAAWNFSLVHPTGYPLYLLLGGVWSHLLPIGDPAYRMNLFSAFVSALAVTFLAAAIYTMTRSRFGALVGAAALAVSQLFWSQATETEVYALNSFFVAFLVWLAMEWRDATQNRKRLLLAWCFVFGLALAHHRSIILLAPAFAAFGWLETRKTKIPFFQPLAPVLILLPLWLYLFIPLRLPNTPYATLGVSPTQTIVTFDSSPAGVVSNVLGQRFENVLGWRDASWARLSSTVNLLVTEFNLLAVIIGLFGIVALGWRRDWSLLTLILLGAIAIALFDAVYFIGDIRDFYTPIYFLFALVIGIGAAAFGRVAAALARAPFLQIIAPAALLALPLFTLVTTFNANDHSTQVAIRENWNRLLALPLGDNAIIVSNDRDEMIPMWYMQYVQGVHRDWLGLFPLITPAPEHADVVRVIAGIIGSGRPVYLNKAMPGLEVRFPIDASGAPWALPLVLSDAYPPPAVVSNVTLGDSLQAIGFTLTKDAQQPDSYVIQVDWRVAHQPTRDYTSYLHLLDTQGNKVLQANDHPVGGDYYPTSQWRVGETLRDTFVVNAPPDLKASTYRIIVGMYTQPDLEQIGEPVEIGEVVIGK